MPSQHGAVRCYNEFGRNIRFIDSMVQGRREAESNILHHAYHIFLSVAGMLVFSDVQLKVLYLRQHSSVMFLCFMRYVVVCLEIMRLLFKTI